MTLGEKQRLFVRLVGDLIGWAYANGYELSFGETVRSEAAAAANAATGTGISRSNHIVRLAIDLNLFRDGRYEPDSDAHKPLGDYWKTLDPLCRWGGDFKRRDGNHYSLEHEGIK